MAPTHRYLDCHSEVGEKGVVFHTTLNEGKLLTPRSSYATLEKPEACLMVGCLVLGPGLLWIDVLLPDKSRLRMIGRTANQLDGKRS
jgi:hypothetical protein